MAVSPIFALGIAARAADWMERSFCTARFLTCAACALLMTACSKVPTDGTFPVAVAAPTPEPVTEQTPPVEAMREEPVEAEPAPAPTDANSLERRFIAAQRDPAERIAVVRELADVPPATALAFLNRLYAIERREDVKMEMLSALGDLDHEQNRDNQLALCTKALAPGQPPRVRYVAVQLLGDLGDPRGRAILISLTKDGDREVRAAAVQMLRDLREE